VKHVKAAFQVITVLLTSLTLASCGGSGDSSSSLTSSTASLNGTWLSSECEIDDQQSSTTQEMTFSGNNFTVSNITYLENTGCSGDLALTVHLDGALSLPAESAQTNNVTPIDFTFLRARQTASAGLNAILASQGTTLADVAATQGITDVNNIPISMFLPRSDFFTIFARSQNTIRFGEDSSTFDGSSPELRHNTLGAEVYTLMGTNTLGDNNNNSTTSQVIGVVFDQGELENSFDFTTGLVISNLVGGGAYMVLEDRTVIQTSTAPGDFDFDAFFATNPNPMVLSQLGIPESEIFPPLESGFTFDFRGEFNTPGVGGPTFRNIVFTNDGLFELNNNTLLSGPVILDPTVILATSSSSSGRYSIAGNSIELRFGNGTVERLLFATDGNSTVIIGQERYRTP